MSSTFRIWYLTVVCLLYSLSPMQPLIQTSETDRVECDQNESAQQQGGEICGQAEQRDNPYATKIQPAGDAFGSRRSSASVQGVRMPIKFLRVLPARFKQPKEKEAPDTKGFQEAEGGCSVFQRTIPSM